MMSPQEETWSIDAEGGKALLVETQFAVAALRADGLRFAKTA
jgi:hypothetical protein